MNMRYGFFNMNIRPGLLAAGVISLGAGLAYSTWGTDSGKHPTAHLKVDDSPMDRQAGSLTSFAPVIREVGPSVVRVFIKGSAPEQEMQNMLPDHPFFRQFMNPRMPSNPKPKQGVGSGVIVTEDGYLLTNAHVVRDAQDIRVLTEDGKEYDADVVGADPKTDIAVLKIEAKGLPCATLGDSDHLEIGDLVLAVGNPFGLGQTVTMGMVSAKGRANMGLDYEDFIQTDAAINPGNSGGALVDARGRLIGINTAILSRSGGNQGIGFAVPINLARSVLEDFIQHGHVVRGYLGVLIQDMNEELAAAFDAPDAQGALVAEVQPDTPAAEAGLKSGDIIRRFAGKPVQNSRELKLRVADTDPGKAVEVQLLRDGKAKTLELTLKALDGKQELAANTGSARHGALAGLRLEDLDPRARRSLGMEMDMDGALVAEVAQNSAAERAGLRAGDVLLEVNRQTVSNAKDAYQMARASKSDRTLLRVWRNGAQIFLVLTEKPVG